MFFIELGVFLLLTVLKPKSVGQVITPRNNLVLFQPNKYLHIILYVVVLLLYLLKGPADT